MAYAVVHRPKMRDDTNQRRPALNSNERRTFFKVQEDHKASPDTQACFSRAFSPENNAASQRPRPDRSRIHKSLFGSTPRTLRENSETPAGKLRMGRVKDAAEDKEPSDRIIQISKLAHVGRKSTFHETQHGEGRPSSNGSTPRDSSLTYLYREKGGMTGTMQYSRPDSRDATSSERTRERQGLREAWKEEEREKETESDQSENEKRPTLSYLMEGVRLQDVRKSSRSPPSVSKSCSPTADIIPVTADEMDSLRGRDRGRERGHASDRILFEEDGAAARLLREAERLVDKEREMERDKEGYGDCKREMKQVQGNLTNVVSHSFTNDEREKEKERAKRDVDATYLPWEYSISRQEYGMRSPYGSYGRTPTKNKTSDAPRPKGSQINSPDALTLAMHKMYRLQVENTALKKQVQASREITQTATENKTQFVAIESLLRRQLEEKDQALAELQTTVSELRSHLRLVQRESDTWQARATQLSEENEKLLADMENGGHPILEHMDQVVGKLREDCNSKVEELLKVQNQMLQQQVELRHRDERIKQQAGEIEALNRAMSNLRDYVVDSDPFLTSDRPYM